VLSVAISYVWGGEENEAHRYVIPADQILVSVIVFLASSLDQHQCSMHMLSGVFSSQS
jgi:hypothetical protein